ncbi:MAG: hypothetical protein ACTSVI_16940 [Promethearchaeota archaeon]
MHIDNSPIPEGEIDDFEEAWEEITGYVKDESVFSGEKSYIMLEDRNSSDFLAQMGVAGWYNFPRIIMTPIEKDKWGVIINDDDEKTMTTDELEKVVRDFFNGKFKVQGGA